MNKTIVVNKKFENQTKSVPAKTWWSIYDKEGNKYSIWDAKVASTLEVGVEATVEYYTKDSYHTITAIIMANAPHAEVTHANIEQLFPDSPALSPAKAKAEIPEVASAIYERMKAYEMAVRLIVGGQAEYKDVDKLADSALAYIYKTPKAAPVETPMPDLADFLRSE